MISRRDFLRAAGTAGAYGISKTDIITTNKSIMNRNTVWQPLLLFGYR